MRQTEQLLGMDDNEALLHLVAGSREERDEAIRFLYDRHHARLAATISSQLMVDELAASAGVARAIYELDRDRQKEVPKLLDRTGEPWRWLLRRGLDRTVDEVREHRRLVSGVPKAIKDTVSQEALEDIMEPMTRELDPGVAASSSEQETAIHASAFEFLSTLQGVNRSIILRDMIFRYQLLPETEAEQVDEELISRCYSEGIHTDEALKRQRSRLNRQLRDFLRERGHDDFA